ncbi:MAG: hypothetical protein R3B45_01765 [Bdellovibrionota bacterium]
MSKLERDHFVACEKLVKFLNDYSSVLERQLAGVYSTIDEAINGIMESITKIATETESSKSAAEATLEETYLAPSAETKELVSSIQDSVDNILNEALADSAIEQSGQEERGGSENTDKLRRLGGYFSKHMESMSTMDDAVAGLLMDVMGALSNGDVISQRLEHLSRSVTALKLGLSYVLVDINKRFTVNDMKKLRADLNDYMLRQYSSEEERLLHEEIMGKIDSKTNNAS